MKRLFQPSLLLSCFCWIISHGVEAQVCDNLALAFDGNGDFITLTSFPPPNATINDFTVELWFYSNPSNPAPPLSNTNLRRLFSMSGSNGSLFDVGIGPGGVLAYYYINPNTGPPVGPVTIPTNPTDLEGGFHHLAVISVIGSTVIYLDCNQVAIFPIPNIQLFFDQLTIGHTNGGSASQDWDGQMDEIRFWDHERSSSEICNSKDCTLSPAPPFSSIPGLIANWTLDQPGIVPGGPNNLNVVVDDMNGNNDGTLTGFDLATANTNSNFICSTVSSPLLLNISDEPSLFPISYISICEGTPVNFCVSLNGNAFSLPSGATVTWQSSDNGAPFVTDPDLFNYFPAKNALCFPVKSGVIKGNCSTSVTGFADRKYRAVIKKSMLSEICTFTAEGSLQICCPGTNAQVTTTVLAPLPFNNSLCDDPSIPVTIDVSLTGLSFLNVLNIEWCLNGQPLSVGNVTSFTYNGPAIGPKMCFQAKFQNCSCPLFIVEDCIPVDQMPMCGMITGMSSNLLPDDPSLPFDPDHYVICPGNSAEVGMVNPPDFKNCSPVWQFHYDNENPVVWQDLPASSPVLNTNTLPQVSPPLSPYLWPPGKKCIYYRIECRPFGWPNSGCNPCHSDSLQVCLMPSPLPDFIIGDNWVCVGGSTLLSLNNPNPVTWPAYTYNWFCKGIGPVGTGTQYLASQDACYWVEISNGCESILTPPFCVDVCVIVPVIECPTDNPCGCDGLPITLNGCNSYDTCPGTTLTYSWSASNGGPVIVSGPGGCMATHTPSASGTTYTLIVTNNYGCTESTTLDFLPCQ